MATTYTFSDNGITNYLHDYFHAAWVQSGNEHKARGACQALISYISTARAPIAFEKAMLRSDPAELAKISLEGGSDEEILFRIKRYLKRYIANDMGEGL